MLNTLSATLRKHASGWLVLVFFAGALLFNAVILPAQQAGLAAISGGATPIDLEFFYTPGKVYSMVAAYGEAGRADYRTFVLTGDIIYPIVYTSFFALLITWLFRRGFAPHSSMQTLNVLPLGAWLFDLLENLGVAGMLSMYPSTPAGLARAAAICTLGKWLFVGACILLILTGIVMALRNGFKQQKVAGPARV